MQMSNIRRKHIKHFLIGGIEMKEWYETEAQQRKSEQRKVHFRFWQMNLNAAIYSLALRGIESSQSN